MRDARIAQVTRVRRVAVEVQLVRRCPRRARGALGVRRRSTHVGGDDVGLPHPTLLPNVAPPSLSTDPSRAAVGLKERRRTHPPFLALRKLRLIAEPGEDPFPPKPWQKRPVAECLAEVHRQYSQNPPSPRTPPPPPGPGPYDQLAPHSDVSHISWSTHTHTQAQAQAPHSDVTHISRSTHTHAHTHSQILQYPPPPPVPRSLRPQGTGAPGPTHTHPFVPGSTL